MRSFNVHTIAIQVPISRLTADGKRPTDPLSPKATIGVYGAAYRQKARFRDDDYDYQVGPFTQVSRLGNPLFNEVIVPMGRKDEWNRKPPHRDYDFAQYVARPELGKLLPVLYPGVFPNLAAYDEATAPTCWRSSSPASRPGSSPGSRTSPGRRRPTCCGSTWRSRRAPAPTSTASSAATSPGSRTAGGCSTTSSPSSCAPSPG